MPQTLRWLVKDAANTLLDITGNVETEFCFGHGRGYIEYVDIRID